MTKIIRCNGLIDFLLVVLWMGSIRDHFWKFQRKCSSGINVLRRNTSGTCQSEGPKWNPPHTQNKLPPLVHPPPLHLCLSALVIGQLSQSEDDTWRKNDCNYFSLSGSWSIMLRVIYTRSSRTFYIYIYGIKNVQSFCFPKNENRITKGSRGIRREKSLLLWISEAWRGVSIPRLSPPVPGTIPAPGRRRGRKKIQEKIIKLKAVCRVGWCEKVQ